MNNADPHKQTPSADLQNLNRGRKVKIFAGVVALLLIIGFVVIQRMKSAQEAELAKVAFSEASTPTTVDVTTVMDCPSSLPLTLPGETSAWYESTIYARVNGYVGTWKVDIGDHVQKGQVLATIETPDLDARLAAAQAKVKASQALVMARQADADFAKTTYERWKESPKGVVSEQEREAKKAGYEYAVAQLNHAKAQVGLDQATVDQYNAYTQFKLVTAPYEGTITERHIDIGNLVVGNSASTTPLYRMVKDDPIRVIVFVPQSAASDIKVGTETIIKAASILDRTFKGKVARTANAINPQTRTLRVEADMPNADHALVSGMYVNVTFHVTAEGLVQVPAAALIYRSSGPEVGVVDDNSHMVFRKVTIIRDNGDVVQLGSGVSAGDRIALNVGNQIVEGDVVKMHKLEEDIAGVQRTKN